MSHKWPNLVCQVSLGEKYPPAPSPMLVLYKCCPDLLLEPTLRSLWSFIFFVYVCTSSLLFLLKRKISEHKINLLKVFVTQTVARLVRASPCFSAEDDLSCSCLTNIMGVVISSVVAAGPAVLEDLETPYAVIQERRNKQEQKQKPKARLRRQKHQIQFEPNSSRWGNKEIFLTELNTVTVVVGLSTNTPTPTPYTNTDIWHYFWHHLTV